MEQVTPRVYAETRIGGCNPGFVVTKAGVVMIDTPFRPSDAVKWRGEVEKRGKVKYIINTEHHRDHWTGNAFFNAPVIAHQGTREAIAATPWAEFKKGIVEMDPEGASLMARYRPRLPSITFKGELILYAGGHTFHLMHLPGHTPSETAVYIPEERVVFSGDNVSCGVHPFFHESLPREWLTSLERLKKLDVDYIIPGHGKICQKGYLDELASFIRDVLSAVTRALDKGWSKEEAMERISFLDRFPMPKGTEARGRDLQRRNVNRVYDVLAAERGQGR